MSITLSDLLNGLYGINTVEKINPVVSAVGVTAVKVLNNNPNRVSFIFVNLSVNSIYLSPLNDVSSAKGIYVASNGGYVVMQWDRDFNLVSREWWAVATGAGSNIFIAENISV